MLNSSSKQVVLDYINNLADVAKSQPFEKDIDVYSIHDKMFALVKNSTPSIISLRCDKTLSKILQEKYESVMPGQKLDQDKWISIVDSGQVPADEMTDLVILSYNLAKQPM